jgi:hypothetical protein
MDDYKTLLLSKEWKEKRHSIQTLFKYSLLFIVFLFNACHNKPANENKSNPIMKTEFPEIDGFYFFKCNMSYGEVTNILLQKDIRFKIVNLNKLDEINYPLLHHYGISPYDLADFSSMKIIEGFNLPILTQSISRFQVGFFKDTIFYFKYEQNLETKYSQINKSGDYDFTEKVNNDIYLLMDLSEGLNYKYGPPIINDGDLNAFSTLGKPFFRWNSVNNKGIQYIEKQVWYGKNNGLYICLENMSVRDSSNYSPFEIRVQAYSTIEVLFNDAYAKQISNYNSQKGEHERQLEKERKDRALMEKLKRFDEL